jgi:hypothetical protein
MNQRTIETFVDLLAQSADMHVNHVGLRVEMVLPNIFQSIARVTTWST